jgi:hypothetical protein
MAVGAGDNDGAILQRLAQAVENLRGKFRYYGANSPNMVTIEKRP